MSYHNGAQSPNDFRGGGHNRTFDSPPTGSGFRSNERDEGGFRPIGGPGGGFRPIEGNDAGFSQIDRGRGGFGSNYQAPPPLVRQKREYPFSGHGRSPDVLDSSSFAKLFVGSVPRTAIEEDLRPLFEEHGKVMEVALIKDKRTGQQQGCCFIKYATSEEADRAIRALHNQHTFPGGVGPIQVRYADGERERLGAVEYKLFVGSLNKQATEKEVEEIFSPYGRVEDVYLMRDEFKHSRGCGFVKYSDRDMALAAIKGLSGIYTMRGCDQPLIVRFADPKRPKPGDSRGPSFGGLGFGPRFEAPGARPMLNYGEPMGDRNPPNSWQLTSPPALGASLDAGVCSFDGQLPPRSGDMVPTLDLAMPQVPPCGQQVSPLQKPIQSPQYMGSSFQLNPQAPSTYSQTQTSLTAMGQFIQPHHPVSSSQSCFNQPMVPQNPLGLSGQPPFATQPTSLRSPLSINLQPSHSVGPLTNQPQQMVQPPQHSPSQLAQMLSQQTQTLKASFQSSQQTFSQLQQQLQSMQPSKQGLASQPNSQATKQQPPWAGNMPHAVSSTVPTTTTEVPPSTSGLTAMPQTVVPVKCNWTEHTSPDDYKYYYNSMTGESRWEKPEEFLLFEQKQPKPLAQQPLVPLQTQVSSAQQPPQNQPAQLKVQHQLHFLQHQQLQQPSLSPLASGGPAAHHNKQEGGGHPQQFTANSGAIDPTRFQQGYQVSQEWMWKNKPTGA